MPTLLVQKWTSGFCSCLLAWIQESSTVFFTGVFYGMMAESQLQHLMSSPSKLPSKSCCSRPPLFFPARLSILLHPNLSPQGISCALDPGLTPCFVGNHCLYGGVDYFASCQSIAKHGISHLMCCHHRPVSWLAHAKTSSKDPQPLDPADRKQWLHLMPMIFHGEGLQASGKFSVEFS